MAALAPETSPDDVLPALARNVVTNGYQAAGSNDVLEQTEYLKLVVRYLSQARELEKLADSERCDQGGDLRFHADRRVAARARISHARRLRQRSSARNLNATRAFLTIDSGFPLAELEQDLRTNRPFAYDFKPTQVPILYTQDYWLSSKDRQGGEFIDTFLGDPSLCRFYLGLSKLDPAAVRRAAQGHHGAKDPRLRARSGFLRGHVPGSRTAGRWCRAAPARKRPGPNWWELRPTSRARSLSAWSCGTTAGWPAISTRFLASATMPRMAPVQNYLTDPERMKRFYAAIRGKVTSPGPARPGVPLQHRHDAADRAAAPGSQRQAAHSRGPGGVADAFHRASSGSGKYDSKLSKTRRSWKDPDDVIEALFGLCRKSAENEPLKIFMALSDVDRRRPTPLDPKTADRLAREFRAFGAQYPIFAEVSDVSERNHQSIPGHRGSASTRFTIWLCGPTPPGRCSLVGCGRFSAGRAPSRPPMPGSRAGRHSDALRQGEERRRRVRRWPRGRPGAAGGHQLVRPAESAQDRMLDLLAGTRSRHVGHAQPIGGRHDPDLRGAAADLALFDFRSGGPIGEPRQRREGQQRADHQDGGANFRNPAAAQLAERLGKNALSFGYWPEKHIEAERKLTLRAFIDRKPVTIPRSWMRFGL
jgi:hypothetical protein